MILIESLTVSLFGAFMGLVLGLGFGTAVALALPDSIVTRIAFPVSALAVLVLGSALFGALAGLLPARRAARLDVLQAMAHH
jgi:putative ABC transport system permease protein